MRDPFRAFRHRDDLGSEIERDNDEERLAIGTDDQEVAALKPIVETVEPVPATLGFAAQVTPQRRHTDVTAETTTRSAAEGHAFAGEAALLQQAHDRTFGAIAFVA
jgi:hypothetical protein